MKSRQGFAVFAVLFLIFSVSGCGGGGGDSPVTAVPKNVAAAAGTLQATVGWDNVAGATSYNLYYSHTSGFNKATWTKIPNAISPQVVSPLTAAPYYFVVTAVSAHGESAGSGEATATPTPTPPPDPPANVRATAGSGQATIAWDPVAGATSYNLYHSRTSPVTKLSGTKVTGVSSGVVVTPLARGTAYHFVVTAVNADGESVESSEATAIPAAPNPTYATGDLTGSWNVHVILSGGTPGWYRYTATVDGAGNVTVSNATNSGGITVPTFAKWTVAAGTGLDNTVGVVTETGAGANSSFHGKMSSGKTVIAGTSTFAAGTYAMHVCVKTGGVSYSDADLAGNTFVYNRIFTGSSMVWETASGSTGAANEFTYASRQDPSGPLALPAASTIAVTAGGVVTIGNEPNFLGVMTPDKKNIVGTSTDAAGKYSLRILQFRGQSYTAADLVGLYVAYSFKSATTPPWARGTWTVTSPSATEADVNATNIFNGDGAFTASLPQWTYNVNAQGTVTLAPPGSTALQGWISFGKDLAVSTDNYSDGAVLTITVQ